MSDEEEQEPITHNPYFAKLNFPSDNITIGQIRKDQPNLLLNAHEAYEGWQELSVHSLVCMELQYAEHLWAKAMGEEVKPFYQPRDNLVRELNEFYRDFGISSGPKQTEEILRRFEKEISELAKEALGKGR